MTFHEKPSARAYFLKWETHHIKAGTNFPIQIKALSEILAISKDESHTKKCCAQLRNNEYVMLRKLANVDSFLSTTKRCTWWLSLQVLVSLDFFLATSWFWWWLHASGLSASSDLRHSKQWKICGHRWCSNTKYCISALSLSVKPTFRSLCTLDLRSKTRCHADATNASNWWMPIEPSICEKTLHSIHQHPVRCI